MADDDNLNFDDAGSGSAAPEKKGGFGKLLSGMIKWIIIALAAIIIIVVVVVVTVKITNKNKTQVTAIPTSAEYSAPREMLDWYTSLGTIQTTTCDDPPATVRVDVALGYKKDDKATATEITSRTVELKSFLRRFFSSKTAAELSTENEDALENEIKNGINDKILSSSRIKDVTFLEKNVTQLN